MNTGLTFSRAHEERGQDGQARWASRFDNPEGFVILAVTLKAAAMNRPGYNV